MSYAVCMMTDSYVPEQSCKIIRWKIYSPLGRETTIKQAKIRLAQFIVQSWTFLKKKKDYVEKAMLRGLFLALWQRTNADSALFFNLFTRKWPGCVSDFPDDIVTYTNVGLSESTKSLKGFLNNNDNTFRWTDICWLYTRREVSFN